MTTSSPGGANAEEVRYWNEVAGPRWIAYQAMLDAQVGPLGRLAMERARIAPGERVLDVGCGCGAMTLELGRRVGPTGSVLGLDVSAPMLARAEATAREAGLGHVRFMQADAQTHALPADAFDALYSRFGVMFFADPVAAFANLVAGLRPGGRVSFVCWQALGQNPWMRVPLEAAARHIALPPPPAPDAPGPFSFRDPERVRGILARGGLTDVSVEDVRQPLSIGDGAPIDRVVEFLMDGVGPMSAALRQADPALKPVVAGAVREALTPFATPAGVHMGSACWIVTARRAT